MCANGGRDEPSRRDVWRIFVTNWHQPLPFHVKLAKLARNLWTRAATRSTCCGHAGEPGC